MTRTRVRPLEAIGRAVAAQRGALLCWAPICLAAGIGGYFALPREPGAAAWLAALAGLALAAWGGRRLPEDFRPLAGALALALLGAMLAGLRAHLLAAPVLPFPHYYGPVEGRIVWLDRSASDAPRLTLDQVVLAGLAPDETPRRVRISLHGDQGHLQPQPGMRIILTAHLSPPGGPVEPGGFDFQRKAWFQRLGAVGYTRSPALELAPPEAGGGGPALALLRLRLGLADWVRGRLPGDAGAFAAAVMTGDRSAMRAEVMEDLRRSNLAHLLAISGLHMGLVTGFIFAALRLGLALVPALSARLPEKKIAAVGALMGGVIYLALAGGNVATERAFVMVAVMFLAVLFERRAISLRSVAIAALIVLARRPEVLAEPGFQMSFAATVALVAVFGALRERRLRALERSAEAGLLDAPDAGARPPRLAAWLRPVAAVVISSAVAGAATAPVAAAHFGRIADYGLLANLAAVPLMGLVVMPAAVLAVLLAPLGLGHLALRAMAPALEWILWVAHKVGNLEGAITHVKAPPAAVLPMLALGGLWLVLWRGRAAVRLGGAALALLGLALWAGAERPPLLISESGRLMGLMGPEGRALSKPRGDGFAAQIWLENDGDGASQKEAARRPGLVRGKGEVVARLGAARIVLLQGRGGRERAAGACREADLVVIGVAMAAPQGRCRFLDAERLARMGALALWPADDEAALRMVSARDRAGRRLWNSPPGRAGAPAGAAKEGEGAPAALAFMRPGG